MITLLMGENSFELDRALAAIVTNFDGHAEKIDGAELQLKQLPDILMGATLFASSRLVVIRNLSDNKSLWTDFAQWIQRIPEEIHVVLVEPKPDKRTKTYKDLQKIATIHQFGLWSERDGLAAEKWLVAEAGRMGLVLNNANAQLLVQRVGLDQWRLLSALEKLVVLDVVDGQVIENTIEANPSENVFYLFETALKGDHKKLQTMIAHLEATDDPYRLFGLLSGQVFQLSALIVSDQPVSDVAKAIGVHPYAMSQLSRYGKNIDRPTIRKIVAAFADADAGMKSSSVDPWILIEVALQQVAALRQ